MEPDASDASQSAPSTPGDLIEPSETQDLRSAFKSFKIDGFEEELAEKFGTGETSEWAANKLLIVQLLFGVCGLLLALIFAVIAGRDKHAELLGAPTVDSRGAALEAPNLIYTKSWGHAEVVRLAFVLGGIPFEDVELPPDKWEEILGKPAPKLSGVFEIAEQAIKAFSDGADGKMMASEIVPIITHGQFRIAGTVACAQYAADLGINLKEWPTSQQRAIDAMMVTVHSELVDLLSDSGFDADSGAAGLKYCNKLQNVEDFYEDTAKLTANEAPYLHGFRPALGDLAIFSALTMRPPLWHTAEEHACFKWEKWPKLRALFDAVNSSRRLKSYLAAREGRR